MRNAGLLIGTLALTACSIDHVVVAEIVAAGTAGTGDVIAFAGSAGSSGAGNVVSDGSRAQGGDQFLIASGGTHVDVSIDGDAGAPTQVACTCTETQATLCGSDGVSYSFPPTCEDGGICQLPTIACWHACPCLDPEATGPEIHQWFSADCMSTIICTGEFICSQFNGMLAPQSCTAASN